MTEFLIVYAALGFAALGGNWVKKEETRTLGVVSLFVAAALGVPIVVCLAQ